MSFMQAHLHLIGCIKILEVFEFNYEDGLKITRLLNDNSYKSLEEVIEILKPNSNKYSDFKELSTLRDSFLNVPLNSLINQFNVGEIWYSDKNGQIVKHNENKQSRK